MVIMPFLVDDVVGSREKECEKEKRDEIGEGREGAEGKGNITKRKRDRRNTAAWTKRGWVVIKKVVPLQKPPGQTDVAC